ncbi:hypothetical protein [Brevibacillus marinus]|mgnify:CR=1 FL=1|uniref:hypothetical protein n=1 Tax=Brevibacillus marinus TaxID=2496837 RepID=UPI000F83F368|nr:hypothetical protein [Brevibacillus marinus]
MEPIAPSRKKLEEERVKELVRNALKVEDSAHAAAVKELIAILNELLRIKSIVPPISELVICLAHLKPNLHYAIKSSLSRSSHLKMLFEITGDAALAEKRLREFVE